MQKMCDVDPYLPRDTEVVAIDHLSPTLFTLHLHFEASDFHQHFIFHPGQFNMLYLYGVGEVAISIVSDPEENQRISHTIRAVGRVTRALQKIKVGDRIGIRGPFGRPWPLKEIRKKDIVVLTGGLGCAPTVGMIHYMLARRKWYGKISILQGVKHSDDFIFKQQYAKWQEAPDTEIHIAADQAGPKWPWSKGYVTDMLKLLTLNSENTVVLMCGPEMMMRTAIEYLMKMGISETSIYLSMERNMECGIGHCGHCQYGGLFVCKNGPIFCYPEVKALFAEQGF